VVVLLGAVCQGAVPKGGATAENLRKLGYREGDVVYKCSQCLCIKPDRAHHCRSDYSWWLLWTVKNCGKNGIKKHGNL